MKPEQQQADLRDKTIEAVEGGEAWPTSEGMEDPEIVEAFKQYFEGLDESGFDDFTSELEAITNELETGTLRNNGPTLKRVYKHFRTLGGPVAMAGGGISIITLLISVFLALDAIDSSEKELLGKERIAHAKSKIEEVMKFAHESRVSTDGQ